MLECRYSPPKVLEPRRRQLGVAHRVLDIFVSEVGLERSRIVAPVRQGVAAGVAQHVRVNLKAELCLDACAFDHAGKPGGAKRRTAFRCEHVCRLVLVALQPPQRAQFVARIGWVLGVPCLTLRTCKVAVLKST